MKIVIKNTRIDKHVKNNIISMITFACKFYLSKQFINDLVIEVYINSKINNSGECSPIDTGPSPSYFEMYLNTDDLKSNIEEFYKTVMHECVHIKQYALNEMYDCEKSTVFKGKRYSDKPKNKRKPVDYFFKPWEIEAYGSELGLLRQWEWEHSYSELD